MHHGVRIKDSALVAAAVLSNRYITDRFLPDKAIDLVDEAAAKLRTEIDSMPAELDEILRRTMQLEIEREALEERDRRRFEGPAGQDRKRTGRSESRLDRSAGAVAGGEGRRAAACAASASSSNRPRSRSTKPSGSTI